MTPETQAKAAPSSHTTRIVSSTLTPATRAKAGFSATARIARPTCVRVRSACVAMSTTAVTISNAI